MTDNCLKAQAFKLKGRLYTFTVLELLSTNIMLFEQQLSEVVLKAPKMFENSPVVLDCSEIQEQDPSLSLDDFFQCLRLHGLIPVAIQGANPLLSVIAQSQGIAVLNGSRNHDKSLQDHDESAGQEAQATEMTATTGASTAATTATRAKNPNVMVQNPVRSGQQVVSKEGDLIVSASVSHGAELLADGNIHVYGNLRGRALAGINGDRNARIFCQSLEAELISIAGFYRLSDAIEPCAHPCQIYLEGEHICIAPIV